MVNRKPLFAGDSEIDQIFKISKILGTPTEEVWPEVNHLSNFSTNFPKWSKQPLETVVPDLDANGIQLLELLLAYDPIGRISAKRALLHPYFHEDEYSHTSEYPQQSTMQVDSSSIFA
ncbi:unnamed protein product [Ambrosiozyma monospora]|uniref:Unnamed protein product n=1 Tax=Ambrosiozyma monospora TaxID=43982 RepID=A0ACB5SYI0_AMBMO|nr:unnamed protein product [Ambrosiozyma monospora]